MIAYFILVHRYPEQFKRLFRAIYDPENIYLVHWDKRAQSEFHIEITDFLADFPNAHLLTSQNVVWGGYSMVETELNGMKKLLELDAKWDHYINLSGQDFPLQSQKKIQAFLSENRGKDFLKIANQFITRTNTMNRIENYFVEGENGFSGSPYQRSYMPYTTPYIGGQWKILSRPCVDFLSKNIEVSKFRDYYKNTLIADESFFQTVLMNTTYPGTIVDDDKRAIIWVPEIGPKLASKVFTESETNALIESGEIKLRPKTLTIDDLPYLIESNALFGRKFDETIDHEILEVLETMIAEEKI